MLHYADGSVGGEPGREGAVAWREDVAEVGHDLGDADGYEVVPALRHDDEPVVVDEVPDDLWASVDEGGSEKVCTRVGVFVLRSMQGVGLHDGLAHGSAIDLGLGFCSRPNVVGGCWQTAPLSLVAFFGGLVLVGEVIDVVPKSVLRWLLTSTDVDPVDAAWVPGLEPVERSRLAALGGLVNSLAGSAAGPAFSHESLASWLSDGPVPPEDVIVAGKEMLAESPDEGLARLYSMVVSGRSRRTLGTFFTPPEEVVWMVEQWDRHHGAPDAVVDVGAGVGIFTTVAATKWSDSQVWAVDINPITLGLLALRVHDGFPLKGLDELDGSGLRLVLDDFTKWMTTGWRSLSGRRLILGNPPYTRLQLLPADQRDRLWGAAAGLCGRRASLSALITAMSLKALGPEDGLCLLLPAQWLESDYASELRAFLWRLRDRRVELHLFDKDVFEGDAQVDAVALMVGPRQATAEPIVFSGDAGSNVDAERAEVPVRWRPLFPRPTAEASAREVSEPDASAAGSLVLLSDLLTARRGVATGANQFFVFTEAERARLGLTSSMVTPLVRRLLDLPDVISEATLEEQADDERYWLLTVTPQQVKTSVRLGAYIATGEAEENHYHLRHLCQTRPNWFDLTAEVTFPDLVVGQSTKKVFRFVEVQAKATLLNNLYGLTWRKGISEETKADLLAWLRSEAGQDAVRSQARAQGQGLLKIEPRALLSVRVPGRFAQPTETLL